MRAISIVIISGLLGCITVTGQEAPTSERSIGIGDDIASIELHNLMNFSSSNVRLEDFKGKAVILDFWATWCGSCIAAIPKVQKFQQQFQDDLQFFMVSNETKPKVRAFFHKMNQTQELVLPCAIDSGSVLTELFKIRFVPHYVWIDSSGKVCAFTGSDELTASNIKRLIAGKALSMDMKVDEQRREGFDMRQPLFLDSNMVKEIGISYHSILTPYIPGAMVATYIPVKGPEGNRRVSITNFSIAGLYRVAYGDGHPFHFFPYNRMVLDLEDTLKYDPPNVKIWDSVKHEYGFSYDLIIPNPDSTLLFTTMRADLKRFFGLHARIEKRPMNCLIMTSDKGKKLTAENDSSKISSGQFQIMLQNQPFKKLASLIQQQVQSIGIAEVFDETGIEQNVDLTLNVNIRDIPSLSRKLSEYGIKLQSETRLVEVLVLSDLGDQFSRLYR